jgi:hypothetical protein
VAFESLDCLGYGFIDNYIQFNKGGMKNKGKSLVVGALGRCLAGPRKLVVEGWNLFRSLWGVIAREG